MQIMDHSSLSDYELITIDASFRAIFYDAFNCNQKRQDIYERFSDNPDQINQRLEILNKRCNAPNEFVFNNILYRKCLCNFQKDIGFFLSLYEGWDKGLMPFEGLSISSQPAKGMEIIQYIKRLVEEKKETEQKKIDAKQRKSSTKGRSR